MASLDAFSPATRAWLADAFEAPTAAQEGAWAAVAEGRDVLVVAPTGSGKTLAAFLWSLDRIATEPRCEPRLRVLYVSPLKALAFDIERNLRVPLAGIRDAATRLGLEPPDIAVGVRTGDTPPQERRRLGVHPPDILITTPESLFLILTSAARESLRAVDTVIVDEVHAVAGTKRGAHLALSLERLDLLLTRSAQRIGLSATVRPLDEVARFLGGVGRGGDDDRYVHVVAPNIPKRFDLRVEVPVEDMAMVGVAAEIRAQAQPDAGAQRPAIWPAIEGRLVELIRAHRSTIVFANSRRLAERLCARLNEIAEEDIARAHHGSVSREQRRQIEEDLKSGCLPAVVATSSLELGIDMGDVDLVVQVEAPPSVAAGLQRIGRAGHQVGAVSRGVVLPKWRGDLLECAVVIERMRGGEIESLRYPRNPLDVLAQHVVSMVAMDEWTVPALAEVVKRAAPFASLPRSALESVLDMLSGLYPSDEFAELRPRLNWDRVSGVLAPRGNAQHLAVTSGGTIPDRGLFGVYLVGEKPQRVGELDEEMVYESRHGDVFVLGASAWRIEEITHDRVMVTPAPGEAARMPFWHGDAPGRPVELGRAHGAFLREVTRERLEAAGLDDWAATNLLRYLEEQREAAGHLPDDRTLVVERFRDAVGDWRLCIHSPFGAPLHAPWALAIAARLGEQLGVEVQTMHTDDGIVLRLPDSDAAVPADAILFEPEEIEAVVTESIGRSALFASRFRECAARALLLPRRRPGERTPLWMQRQKSASLLQVASGYGTFPIILETMRECLQDVFDVPALKALMADIRARRVRVVHVQTARPSPFASALQLGYVAAFLYEGDAPLAERRAQALTLDTVLLAELMGQAELRDVLDPDAVTSLETELQKLAPERHVRDLDDLHDALRWLGDLATAEVEARGGTAAWLRELEHRRRALRVRVAGEERWIAVEDAARYRDVLGVDLPDGIPEAFLAPVREARVGLRPSAARESGLPLSVETGALADLVGRYARTHAPFSAGDVAARLGLGAAVVTAGLHALERAGRVVKGELRPGGHGLEWCDTEVLRALRRRSLARLRKEAEAVPPAVLGRFLPAWQGLVDLRPGDRRAEAVPGGESGAPRPRPGLAGLDGTLRAVEQLQGVSVPASMLETLVLPSRVDGYSPVQLDELCASGEIVWAGAGAIGSDDGWVALYLAEDVALLLQPPAPTELSELAATVWDALRAGGAMFFRQIAERVGGLSNRAAPSAVPDTQLLGAIWELVWAGRVTNDTLAPLRAALGSDLRPTRRSSARRRPRRAPVPGRHGPPAGAGRWSVLPRGEPDPTRQRALQTEQLLDRHGVLTRGAVAAEEIPGGWAAVYSVLVAMEETGRCRRGYFVEGLGGAQFAMPGAVDRLRAVASAPEDRAALVMASTDPANPYGAALPWPDVAEGHRPGRKAGALVVLVDGDLALYLERGGRTWLVYATAERLPAAVSALAGAGLGRLVVEKANGESVFGTPLARALQAAGFRESHRGLVLRG